MKNSIGKPCEGKLHARFDEGGADNFSLISLYEIRRVVRLYSTVQGGNKNGFTENDLCKEMRKLKIKCDSTDDKDRIKNYEKHLLKFFKGKTHEY